MKLNILKRSCPLILIVFLFVFSSFTKSDPIIIEITSKSDVICYGESNGEIDITVTGGVVTEGYTYQWSTSDGSGLDENAPDQTGLSAGTYNLTVTDDNLTSATEVILVHEPSRLKPSVDSIYHVTCFGSGNGFIVLEPTGGNGTYSYSWSTGNTTDSIGGLDGDLYNVTISDWKGCQQDTSVSIIEPPQMKLDVFTHDVRCYGEDNGKAEVFEEEFVSYVWSTGETTATITNLAPGYYTVTATTTEGCVSMRSIQIAESDPLQVESMVVRDVSCAEGMDGEIDLFVSGGNTEIPYIYTWSTIDGSGVLTNIEDQTELSEGKYNVTISDWKGCSTEDSANIGEPQPIILELTDSASVSCFNGSDGSIDISVTGGIIQDDYTYYWESIDGLGLVSNVEDQEGLTKGVYTITVNDSHACSASLNIILSEPEQINIEIQDLKDVDCFGGNNGIINILVNGGVIEDDYIYTWETIDGFGLIENISDQSTLGGGNYTLTVIDDNQCKVDTNFLVKEPDEIIIISDSSNNSTSEMASDGSILIVASGGVGDLIYTLFPGEITNNNGIFENLSIGEYDIKVTDENNCGPITINKTVGLALSNKKELVSFDFNVFPNPSAGNVNVIFELNKKESLSIDLITIQGEVLFSKKVIIEGTVNEVLNLTNYPKGIYLLHIYNNKINFTKEVLLQ